MRSKVVHGRSAAGLGTLVLVLALLQSVPAFAKGENEMRAYLLSVNRLYEDLEYERALSQIERAKTVASTTDENVALSLYEGVILADMNRWAESSAAFKEALFLRPEAKLPVKVAPKVAQHFEKVRQSVKKELEASPKAPDTSSQTQPPKPAPPAPKPAPVVPEVKPEPKPEPRAEVKREVKPEPKAEVKPEVKREVKPEPKAEVKPEVKAEVKPEVKREVKPEVKREVKPEPKAEVKPEVKREVKPEPRAKDSGRSPLPPEALPRASSQATERSFLRPRVLIPAISGGVLLVAGGASWALSRQELSRLKNDDSTLDTREEVRSTASRGRTLQTLGVGMLGAGVVGLGLAVGMYASGAPSSEGALRVGTDGTSAFVMGRWP